MADDFDAGVVGLSGGGFGFGAGSRGASTGNSNSYEERLQQMRRRARGVQEEIQRQEQLLQNRERAMAFKWFERQKAASAARKEQVRKRLAQLQAQNERALRAKTQGHHRHASASGTAAGASAAGGSVGTVPSVGSAGSLRPVPSPGGAARPTSFMPMPTTEEGAAAASGGREGLGRRSTDHSREQLGESPRSQPTAEEVAAIAGAGGFGAAASPGSDQQQRPQHPQLQPLAPVAPPSPRKRRPKRRSYLAEFNMEDLVKPHPATLLLREGASAATVFAQLPKENPWLHAEEVDQSHEELDARPEATVAEPEEKPSISFHLLGRRFRLRGMQQVAAEVLQCKRDIESFLVSSEAALLSDEPQERRTSHQSNPQSSPEEHQPSRSEELSSSQVVASPGLPSSKAPRCRLIRDEQSLRRFRHLPRPPRPLPDDSPGALKKHELKLRVAGWTTKPDTINVPIPRHRNATAASALRAASELPP